MLQPEPQRLKYLVMVALTTARTLGGRARQTQGGETGQQLTALFILIINKRSNDQQHCSVFSSIAPFIKSINGARWLIALFIKFNSINGAIGVIAPFRRFAVLRCLCRPCSANEP